MPMHISLIAPTICGILQPASSANTFIVVACCNVVKGSLINSDDTWFNSHVASWTIFITVDFSILNTLLIVRLTLPNEKLYSATGNRFTIVIAFINFVTIFLCLGKSCSANIQALEVLFWILFARFHWLKCHCTVFCHPVRVFVEYLLIMATWHLFLPWNYHWF